INFSNVDAVNAEEGSDEVSTNAATLASNTAGEAENNAFNSQGIYFTGVEGLDLNDGALTGSDAADSFEVTGTALTANAINVTNAASAIDAGTGDDAVTVNDTNSTLTGTDNALNTANYQFTSIQTADLNSNELTGTAGTDTFDVTGANALTSAGIDFTNVASVDAGDGDDQVNTNGAALVSETQGAGTVAVDNALLTQQIAFTAVENLDLANGMLTGSDAADSFEVTGTTLTANGIAVTSAASAIDAGAGDDAVTVNDANSTLTGTDNALNTADYQFTSIEAADLKGNDLTSSTDDIDVTGENELTSAGINFTNVAAVNKAGDSKRISTDGADATLFAELGSAVENAIEALGIVLRDIVSADLGGGTLFGSSEADSFEVTGTALTANGITVTNAASAIDAGAGDDVVTVNDTNSTLTGTDNALNTAAYQFTSVETADLNSNELTGTAGADTFDVTGTNALTSAGINFSNVEVVNADEGADQLNTDGADASLFAELDSAVEYALETLGITFRETENANMAGGTLAGSSEADSFEVAGTALIANGIAVTNAASAIDAGTGDDAVTVNDANSTLTGTDNALNTANYQFTSIQTADLNSNELTGTAGADTFDVTGTNALTSAGINFSNVEVVNAGDGADQVNTDGADASLFAELGSAVDYALETL
ncbi:beta strand repeat-containing protein, partial [Thalassolituus maritimus]|uniref:beta strand repeat-containing protein n=1 Tax=Thalassolituus maritimus TaxID=484498 RepID=UPI003341A077